MTDMARNITDERVAEIRHANSDWSYSGSLTEISDHEAIRDLLARHDADQREIARIRRYVVRGL